MQQLTVLSSQHTHANVKTLHMHARWGMNTDWQCPHRGQCTVAQPRSMPHAAQLGPASAAPQAWHVGWGSAPVSSEPTWVAPQYGQT
jgi:hypothetical protein